MTYRSSASSVPLKTYRIVCPEPTSALALRHYAGHPREWFAQLPIRRDDAQTAGPFGHEHPAVREKHHPPRILESTRHRLGAHHIRR